MPNRRPYLFSLFGAQGQEAEPVASPLGHDNLRGNDEFLSLGQGHGQHDRLTDDQFAPDEGSEATFAEVPRPPLGGGTALRLNRDTNLELVPARDPGHRSGMVMERRSHDLVNTRIQ